MSLAQLPPLELDLDSSGFRISMFGRPDSTPLIAPNLMTSQPPVEEKDEPAASEPASDPAIPPRRRPQTENKEKTAEEKETEQTTILSATAWQPPASSKPSEPTEIKKSTPITEEKIAIEPSDEKIALEAYFDDAEDDDEGDATETEVEKKAPRDEKTTPNGKVIPAHPIPFMQAAFEESLEEVTAGGASAKGKLRSLNGKARRERLLAQEKTEEPFDKVWRYRPGQEQHEMHKLLAQISFGVFLLLNGMANSNSQVVTILQGHIDEVDEFLEVVLEDLTQAAIDLNGRIDYLKLPMSNLKAFEELLEDREFRSEILEGNTKIEHILARTNYALQMWDDDVDAGLECSDAFTKWLKSQETTNWKKPEILDIYEAMNGNAEGWQNAFDEMNTRAQELNNLIIKLMTITAEMEKKAGEISRKTWAAIPPFSTPTNADKSSLSSPSNRSTSKASEGSFQSGTVSTARTSKEPEIDELDDDDSFDWAIPGAAPLLPPPNMSIRGAQGRSSSSPAISRKPSFAGSSLVSPVTAKAPSSRSESMVSPMTAKMPSVRRINSTISEGKEEDVPADKPAEPEEPLYLLQPRTYTPQPPASPAPESPARSLMSRNSVHNSFHSHDNSSPTQSMDTTKPTTLRARVSQKKNPPDSIHIPPHRSFTEQPPRRAASPASVTPKTGTSYALDSRQHGNEQEPQPQYRQIPRMVSYNDLSSPSRPQLMASPHSDHQGQYYRPVMASPHSPLQQRPHTSGPGADPRHSTASPAMGYQRQHVRNQPSRLGGMSMLNNVTNANYDNRGPRDNSDAQTMATRRTTRTTKTTGGQTLKKKKSAFGWFKKAFSMDEEEKAAFEARKMMTNDQGYYSGQSPKFLDGRRIR